MYKSKIYLSRLLRLRRVHLISPQVKITVIKVLFILLEKDTWIGVYGMQVIFKVKWVQLLWAAALINHCNKLLVTDCPSLEACVSLCRKCFTLANHEAESLLVEWNVSAFQCVIPVDPKAVFDISLKSIKPQQLRAGRDLLHKVWRKRWVTWQTALK